MSFSKRDFAVSVLVFVSICALTVLVIFCYPRKYRSKAKLLLKIGRESVTLDPTTTSTGETISLHRTRESEIHTTLDMMKNRRILEQVARRVGTETVLRGTLPEKTSVQDEKSSGGLLSQLRGLANVDPIPEEELAILQLESNLSIRAENDSGVVSVDYTAKSPEVAQQVVQNWTEIYQQSHTEMNQTRGVSEFFAAEEAEARRRLLAARETLKRAKKEAGVVTVAGQQKILESQVLAARQAVASTEALLAASDCRLTELNNWLQKVPSTVVVKESTVGNRAYEQMRDSLYRLEILQKELEGVLKESHPKLKAIQAQQRDAEEILAAQSDKTRETTMDINPVSQQLQDRVIQETANQVALRKQLEIEKGQLDQLFRESAKLNEVEQQLVQLESEVEVLAKQHNLVIEKLEQARLSDALQAGGITSVNTIQPASFEARPATPNKKLCAVLGLFAAICGAVGVPLLRQTAKQIARASSGREGTPHQRSSEFAAGEEESYRQFECVDEEDETAGLVPVNAR